MRRVGAAMVGFLAIANVACGQSLAPVARQFVKVSAPLVALTHVRVMDGTGAPCANQTIIISNGKVAVLGDTATVIPPNAQVLDLQGFTVIPGLVRMHDHLFYPTGDNGIYGEMAFSFPRLYLAAGVTTIRTAGSIETYTDLEIKKAVDSGASPGPHMHITGPYLEGKETLGIADAPANGPRRCREDRELLARRRSRQFQSVQLLDRGRACRGDRRGAQARRQGDGSPLLIGFRQAASLGIDNLDTVSS